MDHPIDCVCVCVCVCVRARALTCTALLGAFTLTSRVASEQKGIDYITRSRHYCAPAVRRLCHGD